MKTENQSISNITKGMVIMSMPAILPAITLMSFTEYLFCLMKEDKRTITETLKDTLKSLLDDFDIEYEPYTEGGQKRIAQRESARIEAEIEAEVLARRKKEALKNKEYKIEQLHSSVKTVNAINKLKHADKVVQDNKDIFLLETEQEVKEALHYANRNTLSARMREERIEQEKTNKHLPAGFKPSKMKRRTPEQQLEAKNKQKRMDLGLMPQRQALRKI